MVLKFKWGLRQSTNAIITGKGAAMRCSALFDLEPDFGSEVKMTRPGAGLSFKLLLCVLKAFLRRCFCG